MNKMEYQKPWAEFVQFENEDVITASGGNQDIGHKPECPYEPGHDWGFYFMGKWVHVFWSDCICKYVPGHGYDPNPTTYSDFDDDDGLQFKEGLDDLDNDDLTQW